METKVTYEHFGCNLEKFQLEMGNVKNLKKGYFCDLTKDGLTSPMMFLTKPNQPFLWDIPILTILVQGRCEIIYKLVIFE